MSTAKLTPLGVMVLALLREGDMHPYEMMRLLRSRRGERLIRIQNGTFYHTVSRLEQQGFLEEVGIDREGNRPERTTYSLTPAGDAAIASWVRRELPKIDRPTESRVAFAEAHNLERSEVARLLEMRRELLAAEAAAHRAGLDDAIARGMPEQYLVEIQRQSVLLDAELAWQDALHARLVDGSLPWGRLHHWHGPTTHIEKDGQVLS